MSVERRFGACDDIALLCAVVRNTKLPPDMIGLAIMLIFLHFVRWVSGPGLGASCPVDCPTKLNGGKPTLEWPQKTLRHKVGRSAADIWSYCSCRGASWSSLAI